MQRIAKLYFLGIFLVAGAVGCASSNTSDLPRLETSAQFQFDQIELEFEQLVIPELTYHEPDEIESILNKRVEQLLHDKSLVSKDSSMNKLKIIARYKRRFVGDETPIPSDSLSYPDYGYRITLMDGSKLLVTVEKNDLTFGGGFVMNLKTMAGALRDKKYELEFIDAFANTIVSQVEALRNN